MCRGQVGTIFDQITDQDLDALVAVAPDGVRVGVIDGPFGCRSWMDGVVPIHDVVDPRPPRGKLVDFAPPNRSFGHGGGPGIAVGRV